MDNYLTLENGMLTCIEEMTGLTAGKDLFSDYMPLEQPGRSGGVLLLSGYHPEGAEGLRPEYDFIFYLKNTVKTEVYQQVFKLKDYFQSRNKISLAANITAQKIKIKSIDFKISKEKGNLLYTAEMQFKCTL